MIKQARQSRRAPSRRTLFLLHVTLRDVIPSVWRRAAVAGAISLADLHVVFQIIMGWDFKHLYSFTVADRVYDDPQGDDRDTRSPDPRKTRLHSLGLAQGSTFLYTYDFGDEWEHQVTVEGIAPFQPSSSAVTLLGGERACPPEDCGGPDGYMQLLEALRNPQSQGAQELLEWLGPFDPNALDLRRIADALEPPPSRAV